MESVIRDRQAEYYSAINKSNELAESSCFIEFMLEAIKEAIVEAAGTEGIPLSKNKSYRAEKILENIKTYGRITNSQVCRIFMVSSATATRILSSMQADSSMKRVRNCKRWAYILADNN